jgi:putative DNA methylase
VLRTTTPPRRAGRGRASTRANQTRLKTAAEFGRKEMEGDGFGGSLLRHALFAIFTTVQSKGTREAIAWLKAKVRDYASQRQNASMAHWHKDAAGADLLAGALRNREDKV